MTTPVMDTMLFAPVELDVFAVEGWLVEEPDEPQGGDAALYISVSSWDTDVFGAAQVSCGSPGVTQWKGRAKQPEPAELKKVAASEGADCRHADPILMEER